jgi:glycosyltransferase involved in cell wall biosynthesis
MPKIKILYVLDKLESLGSASIAMFLDVYGVSQHADVDCIILNDESKIKECDMVEVQATIGAKKITFLTWRKSLYLSIYYTIAYPFRPIRSVFECQSLKQLIRKINLDDYDVVIIGAIGMLLYPSISYINHKLIYFKVHDLFSNSLYKTYQNLPIRQLFKKMFYLREFLTMRVLENKALKDTRIKKIYMANSDEIRQYLSSTNAKNNIEKVKQLPFAINSILPNSTFTEFSENETNLLFCGSDGLLNFLGIKWFLNNVYPELIATNKHIKLNIIGGICNSLVDKPWAIMPHIKLHGFVDNLDDEYAKSHIAIVPLTVGSGIKVKLLEAITYKKPIVTTSIGIEGTNFPDDYAMAISDNPHQFGQGILQIIDRMRTNSEGIKACVESNFNYMSEKYNPHEIGSFLVRDIIKDISN